MKLLVLLIRKVKPPGGNVKSVGDAHQINQRLRLHLAHDLAAMNLPAKWFMLRFSF